MSGFVSAGSLAHGILPSAHATPTSIATLRWSTHGYTSAPTVDSPANTHYEARVLGDVNFEQAITIGAGFLGRAALGFGEIALWDGDGQLASLLDGYTIDGRALRLRTGDGTGARIGAWPALAGFSTVFAGTAAGWHRDAKTIRVRLRDILSRLDVPAQTAFYGGGGGLDGPALVKGLPKPQTWGRAFNVAPVYLGVIDLGVGALATFQVHYRAISAVTAVRERGAALTQVTGGAPGIGQYRVFASDGVFQIGSVPAGAITADVEGDASPHYVFTPAKLLSRIATDIAGLATSDLDQPTLDDYDYDRAGAVGLFVGVDERARVIDLVEALIGGTGGIVTQTRAGLLRVAVLAAPDDTPHATLDAGDIRDIAPIDLPDTINPPPKRVEVGYAQNYAPSSDLAAAVTGDTRTWLAQPWRSAAAFDGDVAARHALAQQMPLFRSAFADEAPAQSLADQWLDLYRPGRRRFRVSTGRYLGTLELGYTVQVTWPHFALANSFRGIIEGIREDWMTRTVELTLFG